MPPLLLRISMLLFSCFALTQIEAQSVFSLQRPQNSFIAPPVKGDVAFFYETTQTVKDQPGRWNYRLNEVALANVNILNEDGLYEKTILFNDGDDVFAFLKFEYDAKGKLTQIEEKNELFGATILLQYQYDSKGRVSNIKATTNGKTHAEMELTPKKKSRYTERMIANSNDMQVITEHEAKRPLSRDVFDANDSLMYQQIFIYNKKGLLQKMEQKSLLETVADVVITYEYQYDKQGNWIQMLEHNKATGGYQLVQRTIVYRDDLPNPSVAESPVGSWNCGIAQLVLEAKEDGTFTLIDGKERDVMRGTWSSLGWGRYLFRVRYQDHFGNRRPFRSNQGLTVELRAGRLMMYDERGDFHFDFIAEEICPTPPLIKKAQEYTRWEASLWESPGKRAEGAIPADIKDAFEKVYPLAPQKFKACLGDLCGIIDDQGNVLIPFAYSDIGAAGLNTYVVRQDGKAGLIDQFSQEILPPVYDRIWIEPKIGFNIYGTRKDGERLYYDLEERSFLPFEKDDLKRFNDNRWIVRKDGFDILYDRDFNPITAPTAYRMIEVLSAERYLTAGQNQYWIMDADGEVITGLSGYKYIRKSVFGYLTAQSESNQLYALLDHHGNTITEPIYESLIFCVNEKDQRDLYWELKKRKALAKFRKPNGEEGYLTGLGQELN